MTIRFKLTATVIAVILVANLLFSFITLEYLNHVWMREVQTRVRRNLDAARAAYGNHLDVMAALLRGTARDRTLAAVLKRELAAERNRKPKKALSGAVLATSSQDQAELEAMLHDLTGPKGVDFVALLDPAGRVICRSGGKQTGDDLSADPLVASVLGERKTVSGTVVFSRERLLTEGPDLAQRASIRIIPTETARPTSDTVRSDGMVAAVAVPVLNAQGQLQAVLYGGDLLNQHYEIVDSIKQQVFRDEVYQGKQIGAVTIFLGDLRISTTFETERRRPRGRDPVERSRLRGGAGPRRRLVRPGVRGQRLVSHR